MSFKIDSLCVIEMPPSVKTSVIHTAFILKTCQRHLWIDNTNAYFLDPKRKARTFYASQAYHFLLRVACGLESQLLGETEIFGQLKQAWSIQKNRCAHLEPLMQKIFEDTKYIRNHFLQGLGSTSYGGIVRQMLPPTSKVALLGSGQLAESLLPYLQNYVVGLSARNLTAAAHLEKKFHIPFYPWSTSFDWIRCADTVLCCVPYNPNQVKAIFASCPQIKMIHFGLSNRCALSDHHHIISLEEIFNYAYQTESVRHQHIQSAAQACQERAFFRSQCLQGGWEELFCFV